MSYTYEARRLLDGSGADDRNPASQSIQAAQVHATLALVEATEKQTATLALILVAMQTGMDNHQRAEFDRAVAS